MAAAISMWGTSELAKAILPNWDTDEGQEEVLKTRAYFHGFIPRNVVEDLLQKKGDFLVFEEMADQVPITVVAVRQTSVAVLYYRLRLLLDGRICSELLHDFASTADLIRHYWSHKASLTNLQDAPLRFAVPVQAWQISISSLLVDASYRKLGAGSFGQVARMTLDKGGGIKVPVAVKDCFSNAAKDREAFFREGRITIKCQCPYVVEALGMATLSPPIRMVLEFLPNGDLYGYLKKRASPGQRPSVHQLSKFCLDAAQGFAHIAKMDVIHLDVATRNCLLKEIPAAGAGAEPELRALVADFGLAKEGRLCAIEEEDPVSARWAAPESQRNPPIASSKSDVWSFGVLMWEVFSDVSIPYPEMEGTQFLLSRLEEGYRMAVPTRMPPSLAKLMLSTWNLDPAARPSFANTVAHLNSALATISSSTTRS